MAKTKKKIVRREWTKEDVRQMKSMAKARSGVQRISKALKRTPGATQVMAAKLGISLSMRSKKNAEWAGLLRPVRSGGGSRRRKTLTKLSSLLQNGKYPALSRGLHFFESIRGRLRDSRKRFSALETMCRERAQLAKREFEYWLAEANEWARYKVSDPSIEANPIQLDWCAEPPSNQRFVSRPSMPNSTHLCSAWLVATCSLYIRAPVRCALVVATSGGARNR